MKGKICSQGFLHIERAGELKPQGCPYSVHASSRCGDWCPLFSEPEPLLPECTAKPNGASICICDCHTVVFYEFEDER